MKQPLEPQKNLQRIAQPETETEQAQPQAFTAMQGAGAPINPRQLQAMQRQLGNRAVNTFLAHSARVPVVQRSQAKDATKIAEAEYALVGSGETIGFTALAGGCMAITAYFASGGIGYHMVMNTDNAAQWGEFITQLGGNTVTKLIVDGDMVGQTQGWGFKFTIDDEMFTAEDPVTNTGPRSAVELKNDYVSLAAMQMDGWMFDKASIMQWFEAKFGVKPTLTGSQKAGPYVMD